MRLKRRGMAEKSLGVLSSSFRGKQSILYTGWTMVFKVVSGVSANGRSISQLWFSSETINENRSEALNIDSSFREHYKNRFVPNWHLAKPKEVSLSYSPMTSSHCHIQLIYE